MRKTVCVWVLLVTVLAWGCGSGNRPAAGAHAAVAADSVQASDAAGYDLDEIFFPVAQAERIGLQTETVVPGPFYRVIPASGEVLPSQDDRRTVSATVSGVVSLADPRLAPGVRVRAGEPLFYIDSRQVASGDAARKARAAWEAARAEWERTDRLMADRIVTRRQWEQARAAYEAAEAEYAPYREGGERGSTVKAPADGYVELLDAEAGDFVDVGTQLAVISANRRLRLQADVSQRYAAELGTVRSARFRPTGSDRTFDLETLGGRLLSAGRSVRSGAALVPVTFEFDNDGSVMPGAYAEVWLIGAPRPETITVPLEAVTEQQGLYYVYVRLDDEHYRRTEVKLGGDDGRRVAVVAGLRPGQRVVTHGAVHVRMAAASGEIPHTHSH